MMALLPADAAAAQLIVGVIMGTKKMSNDKPAGSSFFERWSKVIATMQCVAGHHWDFRHDAKPPVVVCTRCGRTDPMPYGDARMPYL